MKKALADKKLVQASQSEQGWWSEKLLFCANPPLGAIPWAKACVSFIGASGCFNRNTLA